MKITPLAPHAIALIALVVPAVVLAHGGIPDGHVDEPAQVVAGASALLVAFSPVWWGLLGVSALLTTALSFGVWKFLHVPPVKRADAKSVTPNVDIKN